MLTRTTTIASPLSRKATLVGVVIRQWTARKLDKAATKELNTAKGAKDDASRVNKLLIESERLEEINSIVSAARAAHYKFTKPWADAGLRILPNVLHTQFSNEFRVLKRNFETAVDRFVAGYPEFVEERKRLGLGKLFKAEDYPPPEEIRSRYELSTMTCPVPDVDDFRSDVLDADTIEDIRSELISTSARVLDGAKKHNAEQIVKVVKHMSEKLKEYSAGEGWFRDSLVENVRELVALLPAFNLTDDPELDRVIRRISQELCAEEPKALRDNNVARETVIKSADDILKEVSVLLA